MKRKREILIQFHRNNTNEKKKTSEAAEEGRMNVWPSLKRQTAIYHQIKQILYDTYFTTDI